LSGSDLHQLRNVGILGGTFDPVHHGHLIAAQWVLEALALDRVLFVPCFCPPHKPNGAIATPGERLDMVTLATSEDPGLEASDVEVLRGGASYTIDTVRHLKRQYPETRFVLIVGSDAFAEIVSWKEHERLLDEVRIVVMVRGGGLNLQRAASNLPAELSRELACAPMIEQIDSASTAHGLDQTSQGRAARLAVAKVPQIEISSSEIRRRIGLRMSIQHLAPDAVQQYIREKGLYEGIPQRPDRREREQGEREIPLCSPRRRPAANTKPKRE